jgi:hypothetical protein
MTPPIQKAIGIMHTRIAKPYRDKNAFSFMALTDSAGFYHPYSSSATDC